MCVKYLFRRSKTVSQFAFGEFMKNLTYQALSQENDDNIFLSFDFATDLAHSIVNTLAQIGNEEGEMASEITDQINKKLDFELETVESPAMQIQLGEEPEISQEPIQASTPLTEKDIREIHDKEKTDYLKTALKLNAVDLESAAEVADSENEKLFQEIINPTPGLTLYEEIDIDRQLSFRSNSDLDYSLLDPLKSRLDDILQDAREKMNSVTFFPKVIKEIPNNSYPLSEITTEDFYIDDSYPDLQNVLYFPQPSTDDRKDFTIDMPEKEMILFKSPSLTLAHVNKKELQNVLNNIIEDLDLNLTETLMTTQDKQDTKQKIVILKKLEKDLKTSKENIEEQLENHGWLQELADGQLKPHSFKFGHDYKNKNTKNKFKNVTIRKRKLVPLTSEEMPSIYSLVPADKIKKTESTKNIFSNIIKYIPPESYKRFKIYYDQSNDRNISKINSESNDGEFTE